MSDNAEHIKKRFKENQIEITDNQAEQFVKYYELLVETNKVMNLTAITEFEEVVSKHFLDSVMVTKYYDFSDVQNFIDVGTGAGFPGIPIKILYPQISITLLDSLGKRLTFLKKIVDNLNLEKITLVHGRAEDLGRDSGHREVYDLCLSRAVANLSVLSEYCTPFIKKKGCFVSYKSGEVDEELKMAESAINELSCKIKRIEKFFLNDAGRSLIFIEKITKISNKYPRKAGIPARKPL